MSEDPTPAALTTRHTFEVASSGDFDELMRFFGPTSVWDMAPWALGTYRGPTEIRRFFEDWFGAFASFEIVPEEIVDLGGGVVFAVGRQEGRPGGWRAAPVRLRHASVFVWERGVAVHVTTYRDLEQARVVAERLAAPSADARRAVD